MKQIKDVVILDECDVWDRHNTRNSEQPTKNDNYL